MTKPHKYTGEEIGLAFLREFARVYQGHIKDMIPDQERAAMVAALDNYEDMAAYAKYREIYWHFLVKVNEHECACAEARYWYLKLKAAIADGDQLKIDETDYFLNDEKTNHEKIETILTKYKRFLYVCRCIEMGVEIVAHFLGIGDSPFRGIELSGTCFKEANKLLREHKELKLKPIRKKDIEPENILLENARVYSQSVKEKPENFNFVFHDMLEI
jgi:hypothetical protein